MAQTMLRVTKLVRKGPSLKLTFFITSFYTQDRISEEYIIAELAKVRFKFSLTSDNKCKIYLSFIKNVASEKSTIRINVSCESLSYLKHFNCSHDWPEWIFLGTENAFSLSNDSSSHRATVRSYVVIIGITVSKEESETYSKLYRDVEFTDFQLTAADGIVAVHKACLAARSDYFKGVFSGKWVETEKGSINFTDLSRKNLEDLKDFIYLGTLPDEGLLPLIVLGKRFLIGDLVAACAKKLAETVLPENYYSLHEHACIYNIPELTSAITELTSDAVVHSAFVKKMNKDNLEKVQTNNSYRYK